MAKQIWNIPTNKAITIVLSYAVPSHFPVIMSAFIHSGKFQSVNDAPKKVLNNAPTIVVAAPNVINRFIIPAMDLLNFFLR